MATSSWCTLEPVQKGQVWPLYLYHFVNGLNRRVELYLFSYDKNSKIMCCNFFSQNKLYLEGRCIWRKHWKGNHVGIELLRFEKSWMFVKLYRVHTCHFHGLLYCVEMNKIAYCPHARWVKKKFIIIDLYVMYMFVCISWERIALVIAQSKGNWVYIVWSCNIWWTEFMNWWICRGTYGNVMV